MVARKTRRKASNAKTPFNRVTNAARRVGKKIRNSVSRVGKKIGNSVRKVFSMKKRRVRRRARKTASAFPMPSTPIAQPPPSPPVLEKGGADASAPVLPAFAAAPPAFAAAPPALSQSP